MIACSTLGPRIMVLRPAAIFQNAKEIEALVVDGLYREFPLLLLEEEHVVHAFQQGQDVYAFTNWRMIIQRNEREVGQVQVHSLPVGTQICNQDAREL